MPSTRTPLQWKEQGNSYFTKSDFKRAIEAYKNGLEELAKQYMQLEKENPILLLEHQEKNRSLSLTLYSNLAMALIKVGLYEKAEDCCNVILEQDPEHVKALYRRALAIEKSVMLRTAQIPGYDSTPKEPLTAEGKVKKVVQASDDLKKCIGILDSKPDQKDIKMKSSCKTLLDELKRILDDPSRIVDQKSLHPKKNDGKTMSSGLRQYLSMNLTLLPVDNPRLPMSSMKYEMLAVRLIAAMEATYDRVYHEDGRVETMTFAEEGKDILNQVLTSVAQAPYCLFPATGSQERSPPITVHLLAFYFRACLSEAAMKKFEIEKFCREATEEIISDEEAYAIASHGYLEVEAEHSPLKGHATSFTACSQGPCMPCTFRLLRSGERNWHEGLQQSCHLGIIEWTACALNRLIENVDGRKDAVVEAILKRDEAGCNSVMHAANDNCSGYSGLTMRMLVQAASFSAKDFDEKASVVRKILNTADGYGATPAMASITMQNRAAMAALVDLGARVWDPKVSKKTSKKDKALWFAAIDGMTNRGMVDQDTCNMICALKTLSEDRECCSYCGKSPANNKLLYCARCNRARYCNKDCQKRGYKKHKFVCSTAKVDQDVAWYSANISAPRP